MFFDVRDIILSKRYAVGRNSHSFIISYLQWGYRHKHRVRWRHAYSL